MEIIANDYFDNMNGKYINSPLAYPIYDHYFILPECKQAHAVIHNYKHDPKNKKLHIFTDLENNFPLMFFQETDFDLNKTLILDLGFSEEDHETYNHNNDRSKRISLPVKQIHKSDVDIHYKRQKMCLITSFDRIIGLIFMVV